MFSGPFRETTLGRSLQGGRVTTVSKINSIIQILQSALNDAAKVDMGQSGAPGTRVRAVAQTAKRELDALRKGIVDARNA